MLLHLLRSKNICHHAQPVKTTTRAIVFKVIDSANSDFEVSIKEALHIKHRNPNLNKQLSHTGYVLHAKDLHIIGLNNNRIIGLNLNVTILNSLQLKY